MQATTTQSFKQQQPNHSQTRRMFSFKSIYGPSLLGNDRTQTSVGPKILMGSGTNGLWAQQGHEAQIKKGRTSQIKAQSYLLSFVFSEHLLSAILAK